MFNFLNVAANVIENHVC